MSVSKRTVQGRKPKGWEHVRRDSKHKKWERKKWGGEKISTDSFFLFTDFYYNFNWLKILFYSFCSFFFFLTFGLKMFSPFLANDCDLFLHIMLALRYYHSMMLRGDQSLLRGHNYSTETTSCWHMFCCSFCQYLFPSAM